MTNYHECLYCNAELPGLPDEAERPPDVDDDELWAIAADLHAPDCEWVLTRAHRLSDQEIEAACQRLEAWMAKGAARGNLSMLKDAEEYKLVTHLQESEAILNLRIQAALNEKPMPEPILQQYGRDVRLFNAIRAFLYTSDLLR